MSLYVRLSFANVIFLFMPFLPIFLFVLFSSVPVSHVKKYTDILFSMYDFYSCGDSNGGEKPTHKEETAIIRKKTIGKVIISDLLNCYTPDSKDIADFYAVFGSMFVWLTFFAS